MLAVPQLPKVCLVYVSKYEEFQKCATTPVYWGAQTSESSVPDAGGIASARKGREYELDVISSLGHPQCESARLSCGCS